MKKQQSILRIYSRDFGDQEVTIIIYRKEKKIRYLKFFNGNLIINFFLYYILILFITCVLKHKK